MSLTKRSIICTYEDTSQKVHHPGTLSISFPSTKQQAKQFGVSIGYGRMEFLSNVVHRVVVAFDMQHITEIQASKQNPKIRIVIAQPDSAKSAYIFKFKTQKESDSTKMFIAERWDIAKGAKKALQNDKGSEKAALMTAILRANPDLQDSYTELVTQKKIMTTKEFFDQPHVKQELLRHQQKDLQLGPLNDVIAEVRKRVERQRLTPGANVYLPPHLVANILQVYPTVRLAYEMWVPHKFDEDKFWTMFCQSALVHNENPDVMRDDQFVSSHRDNLAEQRRQVEENYPVNKTVDLVREENPFEEEHAMLEDNAPRGEGINELDTLRDINLTSNCIIKSTLSDVVHKDQESTMRNLFMGLSHDRPEDDEEHLEIEDKRAYFEQSKSDMENALNEEQRREVLENIFRELHSSADRLRRKEVILAAGEEWVDVFNVDMNEQVRSDLDRASQSSGTLHGYLEGNSDEAIVQRIKQQFQSINQLLRPLWSLLLQPIKVVGIKKSKVRLILDELKKKEGELMSIRRQVNSLGGIIQPILDTIEIARDRATGLGLLTDDAPQQPAAGGGTAAPGPTAPAPVAKKPAFKKMSFGKK